MCGDLFGSPIVFTQDVPRVGFLFGPAPESCPQALARWEDEGGRPGRDDEPAPLRKVYRQEGPEWKAIRMIEVRAGDVVAVEGVGIFNAHADAHYSEGLIAAFEGVELKDVRCPFVMPEPEVKD